MAVKCGDLTSHHTNSEASLAAAIAVKEGDAVADLIANVIAVEDVLLK